MVVVVAVVSSQDNWPAIIANSGSGGSSNENVSAENVSQSSEEKDEKAEKTRLRVSGVGVYDRNKNQSKAGK